MPVLRGTLQSEGALVDILLGWSATAAQNLRTALQPVPPSLTTRAVLDTGAEITCFDKLLIQTLGLPFGGAALANLPAHGGLTIQAKHDASLTVVHPSGNPRDNLFVKNVTVLEVPLASLGYQVLLGRDVLAMCRFSYNGPGGRFRLVY